MLASATLHPEATRTVLDRLLLAWAAAELLLRLANHDAEHTSDWTLPAVFASVIVGINLGFRAATVRATNIGAAGAVGPAGLALLVAGVTLRLWSVLTLGRLFTFAVTV